MIIAIDGPAASGKSTIAKRIATNLNYLYLDTGAMYRAATLMWLRKTGAKKSDLDESILIELLSQFDLKLLDNSQQVFVNGEDVSDAIRANEVSVNVSYIASFKYVRDFMVSQQRLIAGSEDIVLDGRDIGTVVFPNAELKIFMVASPEVRAKRRQKQLASKGETVFLSKLIQEIEDRDKQDMERAESPLKKARGAIEINTDKLSINQVVEEVMKYHG